MTAVYLTMFFIILVALAIGGVVAIGMQGAGRERAPQLANHLAEAARHMNGDAAGPGGPDAPPARGQQAVSPHPHH